MDEYLIGLLSKIEEIILGQTERWTWLRKAEGPVGPDYAVVFAPKHWRDAFPAIGTRSKFDPHLWLVFAIEVRKCSCLVRFSAYPTSNQPLRQRVIGRLVADPEEFNLKMVRKAGGSANHTTLLGEKIIEWREGEEPTLVQVAAEVRMKLDEVWKRIAGIPDALRPIFDVWKKSQP